MENQPTLFDEPRVIDANAVITGRQPTSQAAAAKAFPKSGTTRRRVYDLIRQSSISGGTKGSTSDELQALTGISPNTMNPTLRSLAIDGHILDSGLRRPTRAGCDAIVWVTA